MTDFNQSKLYKYPPITEAVIGITFVEQLEENDLNNAQKKFSKEYPNHQQLSTVNFQLELNQGLAEHNTNITTTPGHRRSSNDQTELIVLQDNMFIVSQLAPYPGWDEFSKRFKENWKKLKRTLGYREIKHIGVRYINRIDIPVENEIVDHRNYLTIYPNFPQKFTPLTAYGVQTVTDMADIKSVLRINSGAVPSPLINYASFLIDIDIVRATEVPQKDEEIYQLLEQIRTRKNEVFESCVTDHARDIFNHGK